MFAKSVAVFALLFAASASALRIDTPAKLTTCQQIDFTYGEGQAKYLLALVHGNDPCGDAIIEFNETSDTKQTWQVNVPAGTQVQPVLIDSTGKEAWGGVITVEKGDESCLQGAKVEAVPPPPPSSTPTKSTTSTKPPGPTNGVANVEAGGDTGKDTGAASSAFVISSAAVAGVVGVAALLL